MPICITCSTPVKNLYTTYSKADDRSLGKGVRLTQCPNCKRFADKYVEHDYIVLFIDLVLIKPQVYRHLLFNRLGQTGDKLDPSILRLGILLILFDVYITWARIEQSNTPPYIDKNNNNDSTTTGEGSIISGSSSSISSAPIITQYLFFLTLNIAATIAQHVTIRTLAKLVLNRTSHLSPSLSSMLNSTTTTTQSPNPSSSSFRTNANKESPSKLQSTHPHPHSPSPSPLPSKPDDNPVSHPPTGTTDTTTTTTAATKKLLLNSNPISHSSSAISTALLVSSCTKLFPILLVIWPTSTPTPTPSPLPSPSSSSSSFTNRATSYISYIVLANNIEALFILLDCGYVVATFLAVAGVSARWVVEGWILGMGGLVRDPAGRGWGLGLGLEELIALVR